MKAIKKNLWIYYVCVFLSFPLIAQNHYNQNIIVENLLKTDTTVLGQKIYFPASGQDEVTISRITFPPGSSTGWHKHERPVFAMVLSGTLKVKLENGTINYFTPNAVFSEVINTFHEGFNEGSEPLVLLAFYLGEKGKPLSVRQNIDKKEGDQ